MVVIDLCILEALYWNTFFDTDQETPSSSSNCCTRHAMLHSFLPDHIKKDAATTAAHSKLIIEMLKKINIQFLVSVLYRRIQMVVLRITNVPNHYTYCQYYSNPLIQILTMESVHQ